MVGGTSLGANVSLELAVAHPEQGAGPVHRDAGARQRPGRRRGRLHAGAGRQRRSARRCSRSSAALTRRDPAQPPPDRHRARLAAPRPAQLGRASCRACCSGRTCPPKAERSDDRRPGAGRRPSLRPDPPVQRLRRAGRGDGATRGCSTPTRSSSGVSTPGGSTTSWPPSSTRSTRPTPSDVADGRLRRAGAGDAFARVLAPMASRKEEKERLRQAREEAEAADRTAGAQAPDPRLRGRRR